MGSRCKKLGGSKHPYQSLCSLNSIIHSYLSGMWLSMEEWTSKDMYLKETELCAQLLLTILGLIINIFFWGEGLYDH